MTQNNNEVYILVHGLKIVKTAEVNSNIKTRSKFQVMNEKTEFFVLQYMYAIGRKKVVTTHRTDWNITAFEI